MTLTIQSNREDDLIRRCQQQDNRAQKQVFEQFAPKMLALCNRYVSDQSQAEDIMVTAFTKVFKRIDQFGHAGSFEGWIRRIMVNESLTYLRSNRKMYLEVDIEKAEKDPDYAILDDHLEAEDLMKLINQLPVGYRTVFNLYAIEGFSHKEIAEKLEISENTSKSQLSRARALLQRHLLEREKMLGTNL